MTDNNNHNNSNIYTHHRNYLDLCQQYVIAGWLTSEQYRTVVVQPMEQMEELNEQEVSTQMERIAEQIQYIISKAQEQKSYSNNKEEEDMVLATTTASKSTSNHQPTRNNMNNTNPNQHHVTWVDQQQQQQQQQTDRSITSKQKENDNSGIFTIPHEFYQKQEQNTTFSIKELFVEMCFFARLGYIQPPCCLHCTYKDYYNTNTNNINSSKQSANNSKKQKCTLPVVWRKDTSIVLHPDTIASNIMIVPCYIVREVILLHHQQSKSKTNSSAMIPIQHIVFNGTAGDSNDQGISNRKSDQSLLRKYQYDPVNKIIVVTA